MVDFTGLMHIRKIYRGVYSEPSTHALTLKWFHISEGNVSRAEAFDLHMSHSCAGEKEPSHLPPTLKNHITDVK